LVRQLLRGVVARPRAEVQARVGRRPTRGGHLSMASPTSPNRQVALGTLQRAGFISSRRGRIQVDGCGLEEASCECYWAIRLTSSALISILFWRTGRSRTTTEGSRRPLAAGRADGTPGVYVPNNSFPGLGTVHRTMQFSQRTYRKYGVRSITRRCVSCPQVAHGARWTRSRRRSIGVPVSVACSGFRGPSGSICASGKCEDEERLGEPRA
jgi:hypothetical protein